MSTTSAAIPVPAWLLGIAGLLPFAVGAGLEMDAALTARLPGVEFIAPSGDGVALQLRYGTVILAFMSGALWGFAASSRGFVGFMAYVLSTLPALYAAFGIQGGGRDALLMLGAGFGGLLLLDALFWQQGLTPRWWLALRLWLTAGVILCLAVAAYG